MKSLRTTLLAWLIGAVLLVGVAGGAIIYRNALLEANAFFDSHLRETALLLRDQAYGFAAAPGLPQEVPEYGFVVQVWSLDGERVYVSRRDVLLPRVATLGFVTTEGADGRWRIFSVVARGHVIQVGQALAMREARAARLAFRTLLPFGVLMPVLALLVWWIVGRALEPLRTLTHSVAERRPAALDPLSLDGLPDEVRPLVSALNSLLGELREALEHERAFIADAAHELRTPLTALDLQMQTLVAAADEAARGSAVEQLRLGVARANRLVQQMLSMARHQRGGAGESAPVALATLVLEVVEEFVTLADHRHIDLGAGRVDAVTIRGDAEALATLLRNLLDNAVRYTPEGGRIDVSLRLEQADGRPTAVLEVADSGPGIPVEERARVMDRFYRVPGTASSGSGIGLALVRAIATRHGGRVELDSGPDGSGLVVRVTLPVEA